MNQTAVESLLQTIVANQELQRVQLDRIEASLSIAVSITRQQGERITRLEHHMLGNRNGAHVDG